MYLSLLMPACMSLFHVISIYIYREMYAYGNGHILASRMATKKSEIILPAWDYGGPLSKELKTHEFFAPQQIGLGR